MHYLPDCISKLRRSIYADNGLIVHVVTELSLKKTDLGFPNQVPCSGIFPTFDVRYLEFARNQGNGCCKELVLCL